MIYTTFANEDDAQHMAAQLVADKLAACVNILPGATSIYRWEGEIKKEEEAVMLVKSRISRKARLLQRIGDLHPYATPAIFVITGDAHGEDYWQWLKDQTCA